MTLPRRLYPDTPVEWNREGHPRWLIQPANSASLIRGELARDCQISSISSIRIFFYHGHAAWPANC